MVRQCGLTPNCTGGGSKEDFALRGASDCTVITACEKHDANPFATLTCSCRVPENHGFDNCQYHQGSCAAQPKASRFGKNPNRKMSRSGGSKGL